MYRFIVNPNASGGKGLKVWRRVEKELKRLGAEYQALLTEKTGDAASFASELTEGRKEAQTIVAVGGDGTVGEVTDGLAFPGPAALGYIPAGSGNDLARSLRLSKNPLESLGRILNPTEEKLLDYGVAVCDNGPVHRRFLVSAGIGMDAAVCENIAGVREKQREKGIFLGKWNYLVLGIKQLILAKPVKGCLILDGTRKVEFNHIYFVSVHIHPYEGGGFLFAPGADPSDGKLDVRVVHQNRKLRLVPVLLGALLGSRRKFPGSRLYTCREAEICLDREMPVHCDGESFGRHRKLHVSCIANQIRMIV